MVQEWKIDEINILEQKYLGITRIFMMNDLFKLCFEGTTNFSSFFVLIPVSPSTCSVEREGWMCGSLKTIVSGAKGSECCCPTHSSLHREHQQLSVNTQEPVEFLVLCHFIISEFCRLY